MSHTPLSAACIKQEALHLGFSHCGISPADSVDEATQHFYRQWLEEGKQAGMHYLENHFEKRMNPQLLVEGTRSVVSVALNYRPRHAAAGIAWYAQGQDYHEVMRERLQALMIAIGGEGRCFVDTAPVLERYWAWRGGLGWIGKHGQLVIPREGSTFFLGELFLTSVVDVYDTPMPNRCGSCQRCMEACPTRAIHHGTMDARRCLSYLTIEHRGELPEGIGQQMGDTFYGCDRCLMACPHLRAEPTSEEAFLPSEPLLAMQSSDWKDLTRETYQRLFKGSAVKRAKYEGLLRNIQAQQGSN